MMPQKCDIINDITKNCDIINGHIKTVQTETNSWHFFWRKKTQHRTDCDVHGLHSLQHTKVKKCTQMLLQIHGRRRPWPLAPPVSPQSLPRAIDSLRRPLRLLFWPLLLCWHLLSTGVFTFPSASHHTFSSHCASLLWLVAVFPSASASPSCCASARHLGIHPVPRPPPGDLASTITSSCLDLSSWLVVTLSGASPPPLDTTPLEATFHGTSLVWFICPIFRRLVLSTDGCCVVSPCHATSSCASTPLVCNSAWRHLPPLPPPYPSRMTSDWFSS